MDYDTWWDTYKPVDNPFQNEGDKLFETFGEEVDYVLDTMKSSPDRVWTWFDGDDGTYVGNGFHYVNRIGYYVTEKSCEHAIVEVAVDKYEDIDFRFSKEDN